MKIFALILLKNVFSGKKETIIIGMLSLPFIFHKARSGLDISNIFLEDDYDYNLAAQVFDPFEGIERSIDSNGDFVMSDEGGQSGLVELFLVKR